MLTGLIKNKLCETRDTQNLIETSPLSHTPSNNLVHPSSDFRDFGFPLVLIRDTYEKT